MRRRDNDADQIASEVARTMAGLENLDDIDVGPYFFARLQARLASQQEEYQPRLWRIVFNSRVVPALLAFFVVVNVITAIVFLRSEQGDGPIGRDSAVEAVADQYLLIGVSSGADEGGE